MTFSNPVADNRLGPFITAIRQTWGCLGTTGILQIICKVHRVPLVRWFVRSGANRYLLRDTLCKFNLFSTSNIRRCLNLQWALNLGLYVAISCWYNLDVIAVLDFVLWPLTSEFRALKSIPSFLIFTAQIRFDGSMGLSWRLNTIVPVLIDYLCKFPSGNVLNRQILCYEMPVCGWNSLTDRLDHDVHGSY